MASISQLPQELLEKIASYLTSQYDLLNLVHCTQPVYTRLRHVLFGDLRISPPSPKLPMKYLFIPGAKGRWDDNKYTGSLVTVHKPLHLRQLLSEQSDLRRCVKTVSVVLPETYLPQEIDHQPASDEIAQLIGIIFQSNGGRLPTLHIVGTGTSWPYDAFAQTYELRSIGPTPFQPRLSIEQLFRCFTLPKLRELVLGRHYLQANHLIDMTWSGTSPVKRLLLDYNVESMDVSSLEHMLSWPSALEVFSCRGSQDFWSTSATEGSVSAVIELLQTQQTTLRALCFLPGQLPQQRFYRNSRRLAHGLERFELLKELYIPLEHLQYFPSDQGFEQGSNSLGPCKMPPNLQILCMTVHLRLGRDCPDPDDMHAKASTVVQLASQCPSLEEIRLHMIYSGAIKHSWGPELLRRRAEELTAVSEELRKQHVRLVGYVVLQERGWKFKYGPNGPAWGRVKQWLGEVHKACTEQDLLVSD